MHGLIEKFKKARRLSQFIILVSFLLTFAIVRLITFLQKAGTLPAQHSSFHLHHLVPGIFLLLIAGYIGIAFWSNHTLRFFMAALFGIGAALTIDEFALWLFLRDVYWSEQGRGSVDAAIFIIVLLITIALISEVHDHAWLKKLRRK